MIATPPGGLFSELLNNPSAEGFYTNMEKKVAADHVPQG
jgi:hypothetical protein